MFATILIIVGIVLMTAAFKTGFNEVSLFGGLIGLSIFLSGALTFLGQFKPTKK